ncbi:MAG: cyclodeaminase/cyclohydrolase family protein [Candidatus Heimdallarchaeota archaeon]|nr:cyclodeaminase/cyclohydrolase family protein [Candidatus Heimdallarchaeota archaeon]MCK4770647.1 cyclodeaminase/cyclohydrolase family protein [Candidatus Heimdallarchaeota archaeon]
MEDKMLIGMKITDFLNELASSAPAPGGGAAAAIAGAMGAALGSMVARLTIGKEGYEDVEDLFKEKLRRTEELRKELTGLVDKDANAFSGVIAAFGLPKDTEEQVAARSEKILAEYKVAAEIPLETVKACKEVIDILNELGTKGNVQALSDIGVGALCALTGLKSAAHNVEINLAWIKKKDADYAEKMYKELEELIEVEEIVAKLDDEVKATFG